MLVSKINDFFAKRKWLKRLLIIIPSIALIVVIIVFGFKLKTIEYVSDQNHFTTEEVKAYLDKEGIDNSFWFLIRSVTSPNQIDLFDKYEVKLLSPMKVRIIGHEKSLKGYIEYNKVFYFFDKKGEVLKTSSEKFKGIPKVKGLDCTRIEQYKKIQTRKKNQINSLLEVANTIEEYNYDIRSYTCNEFLETTVKIKKLKVMLGKVKNLKKKLSVLNDMYKNVEHYKGSLDMKYLNPEGKYILKKAKK